MKRTLAILLAMLMLVSMLAACSNQPATPDTDPSTATDTPTVDEPSTDPADGEPTEAPVEEPAETPTEPAAAVISYPLVDNPVTYEVIANGQISHGYPELEGDLNNVLAVQKVSEITNVNINWEMPMDTSTTVSLMLVSEDYTDGMMGYTTWLGSSLDYCVEEEIILDLGPIFKEYCPNYWNAIHADEDTRRAAVTDSGNYAAMYKLTDKRPECYLGYYVSTPVLEEAGFSASNLPVTYEDFESILAAGKDDCNAAPLYLDQATLLAGYDVGTKFNHTGDNRLFFGPTSENYRNYLSMLADWNAKGYIEPDFATRITFFVDAGVFMSRDVIAYPSTFAFRSVFEGAGLDITSIPYPKLNADDLRYQSGAVNDGVVCGDAVVIFATTEQPELLAQWFDYTYSEEGSIVANLGVEGISYDFDEAGNYVYPLNPEDDVDLLTFNSMMTFKSLTWREYIGESEARANDRAVWGADWSYEKHYAQGSLTAEESENVSTIMTDIDTYVSEFTLGVIAGTRSIDEWDEYVAYIESLGLADCLEAYQAAHDRYQQR